MNLNNCIICPVAEKKAAALQVHKLGRGQDRWHHLYVIATYLLLVGEIVLVLQTRCQLSSQILTKKKVTQPRGQTSESE